MPHPAQQIVFQEYIDTVVDSGDRVQRLTEQVGQQSQESRLHELIKALQSMRGISLIVAARKSREIRKRQEGLAKEVLDIFSTSDLIKAWKQKTGKDIAEGVGQAGRFGAGYTSVALDVHTAETD